ncbi:hypothetical protein AMATHDRAFT_4319 [Amanita thiersii Skay4041]|uniref:Peptidase M24 domain-containing protein n=1 Tax=Amanita thiersii Skay4041 TaxID=703135 RepID=A0A2A9NQV6_9AGAR|nr:hypothetical protein AMATHDRAFT_4319 [Amanita thiersii Skay4041]
METTKNIAASAAAVFQQPLRPTFSLIVIALLWLNLTTILDWFASITDEFPKLQQHCPNVQPVSRQEFEERQRSLAQQLYALNASAYIAEPGANALYYGNISKSSWSLSERPLLLVITPTVIDSVVDARLIILTPKFETTRAKSLVIPSSHSVQYVEWAEDADPYQQLATHLLQKSTEAIYVDESIRHFIVDGLQAALPDASVTSAPSQIKLLRERKSAAELALLKCANEATLLAIRRVHRDLYLGIQESQARAMMSAALSGFGLKDGHCLVLFGINAALPHGAGTDRELGLMDFALFDCTGSLHGYYSDVTRTVAMSVSDIPPDHIQIWYNVQAAQAIAQRTARAGVVAQQVDKAARSFLESVGKGSYFTHRLGHGIGLEVHEQPYLRGGSEVILKSGHTFSDEPGVYIEGKLGVRLEDCFYINESGEAVFFTEGIGGQSRSPWSP